MNALRRGVGSDSSNVQTEPRTGHADVGPAQPQDDVRDEVGEREERRDQQDPEGLRVGDHRDLRRRQPRREPQHEAP